MRGIFFMLLNIETNRMRLRPFTERDTAFIQVLLNTEGWLRFIGDRHVHDEASALQYLHNGPLKSYTENGFGLLCMEWKEKGEPVGMSGLIKRPGLDDIDIGFALLPHYMGIGLASEAVDAILAALASKAIVNRVVAITNTDNEASQHVLKKAGFVFEKLIDLHGDTLHLYALSW